MDTTDEAFSLSAEQVLWRYMDVAALIWLLAEGKLFFRYPATFEDQFEGQYCKVDIESLQAVEGESGELNRRFFARIGEFPVAISCWHAHDNESAVMWKAYGARASVCVRSSVQKLRSALPVNTQIARVRYIDYDVDHFGLGNALVPYFHKRVEYLHEQEVRAIVIDGSNEPSLFRCGSSGTAAAVQPQDILEEIVLGPDLSPWFTAALKSLVESYGFNTPVRATRISASPYHLYKRVPSTILLPWDLDGKVAVPPHIFGVAGTVAEQTMNESSTEEPGHVTLKLSSPRSSHREIVNARAPDGGAPSVWEMI